MKILRPNPLKFLKFLKNEFLSVHYDVLGKNSANRDAYILKSLEHRIEALKNQNFLLKEVVTSEEKKKAYDAILKRHDKRIIFLENCEILTPTPHFTNCYSIIDLRNEKEYHMDKILEYGNILSEELKGNEKQKLENWLEAVEIIRKNSEEYDRKCLDCFSEISKYASKELRLRTLSQLLKRHSERFEMLVKFAWPCDPFKSTNFSSCLFGVDVKDELKYHAGMEIHYASLIDKIEGKENSKKMEKYYKLFIEKPYELCKDCFSQKFSI